MPPSHRPDPFLAALAVAPPPLLLTEKDVAALLQCSTRLLQQWRAEQVRPPHWVMLGDKLIRYPAHRLAAWIHGARDTDPSSTSASDITLINNEPPTVPHGDDGLDEPVLRGGRRKITRHASFSAFLAEGHPQEEWLFVLKGPRQRPIDFTTTLASERSDDDEPVWLCFADYLTRLNTAAAAEASDAGAESLDGTTRSTPATPANDRRL